MNPTFTWIVPNPSQPVYTVYVSGFLMKCERISLVSISTNSHICTYVETMKPFLKVDKSSFLLKYGKNWEKFSIRNQYI